NSGKMAVVLGAEVESIFDCFKNNTACDQPWISSQLQKYYDMGLRELFPIVHVDNRFGGTAIYTDIFDFTNKDITGDYWTYGTCPDSIDYHLDLFDKLHDGLTATEIAAVLGGVPLGEALLLRALIGAVGVLPDRPPPGANCNARGLTS